MDMNKWDRWYNLGKLDIPYFYCYMNHYLRSEIDRYEKMTSFSDKESMVYSCLLLEKELREHEEVDIPNTELVERGTW